MAGSATQVLDARGAVGVVTLTFTADASDGSFPETAIAAELAGRILALETNPGSPAPQSNYDIVMDNQEGHDVLEGVGANRHTSNSEKVAVVFSGTVIHPPVAWGDTLTVKLTNNNVNSAVVVVKIYYEGAAQVPA